MSVERFEWLQRCGRPRGHRAYAGHGEQRQEIYDKCAELARDPANEIVNQFSEFGNYLGHGRCTGPAPGRIFEAPTGLLAAPGRFRRRERPVGDTGRRGLPEREVR
jgi:hypothetical protein